MTTQRHVLVLVVVLSSSSAFAQLNTNLLNNPGAESGNLTSWTVGGDANPTVDSGTFDPGINPHTGSFDFRGGAGALGTLAQTVSLSSIPSSLIDSGAAIVTFGFWEQGLNQGTPSDDVFISLVFLDASSSSLGTVTGPEVDSHGGTWLQSSLTNAVPAGTRSITYTMNFVRHSGSDNDGFADDNSLVISSVPESSTITNLVIGLAFLVGIRRLRRATCSRVQS
jgi:hypothetical protein